VQGQEYPPAGTVRAAPLREASQSSLRTAPGRPWHASSLAWPDAPPRAVRASLLSGAACRSQQSPPDPLAEAIERYGPFGKDYQRRTRWLLRALRAYWAYCAARGEEPTEEDNWTVLFLAVNAPPSCWDWGVPGGDPSWIMDHAPAQPQPYGSAGIERRPPRAESGAPSGREEHDGHHRDATSGP